MTRVTSFMSALIASAVTCISPAHATTAPTPIVVYESGGRLLIDDGATTRALALSGTVMKWSLSPSHTWLAVRTTSNKNNWTDMRLHMISVADGTERLTQALVADPVTTRANSGRADTGWVAHGAIYSVGIADAVVWSPDTRLAAFVSAQDGPSSDLYDLDLTTLHILRLTDGITQAAMPVWSPDNKWVAHIAVTAYGGGSWNAQTVWAAAADGSSNKVIYDTRRERGFIISAAWLSPDSLLIQHAAGSAGPD